MKKPKKTTPSGTLPGAASAGSGQTPAPINLKIVALDVIIEEINRRENAGECVSLIITPSDLSEYWESDESGAMQIGSDVPNLEIMRAVKRETDRWKDNGGFTEIMEICRDAWQSEQARQLTKQEKKGKNK